MNIVSIKKPPSDLATVLRGMADQVDKGELTDFVGVACINEVHEFYYGSSANLCLVMATLLLQKCIDQMRC